MGLIDSQTLTPRFDAWRHTQDKNLYLGFIGDPLSLRLDLFIRDRSYNDGYVLRKILLPSLYGENGFEVLPSEQVVYTSKDIESLTPAFLKLQEERNIGKDLESRTVLGISQYLGKRKISINGFAIFAALSYQNYRKNIIS